MTIDEQIAILQAAKAGKAIEFIPRHSLTPRKRELWTGVTFNFVDNLYRIKREPREWWISLRGNDLQNPAYWNENSARAHMLTCEVVRVREVLDGEQ